MSGAICESFSGFPPQEYTALQVRKLVEKSMPELQTASLVDVYAGCIATFATDNQKKILLPVVTGWIYYYRRDTKLIVVNTRADGVVDAKQGEVNQFYRESAPIKGWTVDSSEVIEIARRLELPLRDSLIMRVHMWRVNGIDTPAWTVPYHLGGQQLFLVDASSGQILCPVDEKTSTFSECVLAPKASTTSALALRTATPMPLSYDATLLVRPLFYKGDMPLKYKELLDRQRNLIVIAHIFSDWTTRFTYKDSAMESNGIASHATTVDSVTGKLLAEADLDELVPGQGIWIKETHYTNNQVGFQARSFFPIGKLGDKQKEIILNGVKQREYYFIWPTSRGVP